MPRSKLESAQRDKLIGLVVAGFNKRTAIKRMKDEEGIEITDKMWVICREKAKKEAEEAKKKRREAVYEKSFAVRETRLDTLIAHAERILSSDIEIDNWADFKRATESLLKTLKHIATELHEWQTGDTYNIVFNIMNPVLEELALLIVRHVPEGLSRETALADLKRTRQTYLEQLPEAKEKALAMVRQGDNSWKPQF